MTSYFLNLQTIMKRYVCLWQDHHANNSNSTGNLDHNHNHHHAASGIYRTNHDHYYSPRNNNNNTTDRRHHHQHHHVMCMIHSNPCTNPQHHNNTIDNPEGTLSRRQTKHGSSQQIPLTKSKLPSGYKKHQTRQGQIFFVDSQGQKYWYDPSVPRELLNAPLNLDVLVGKLSSTWEIKQAPSGKIYYVNHIKKTTQFTDPRLVAYREYLMTIISNSPKPLDQHSSVIIRTPNTASLTRPAKLHANNYTRSPSSLFTSTLPNSLVAQRTPLATSTISQNTTTIPGQVEPAAPKTHLDQSAAGLYEPVVSQHHHHHASNLDLSQHQQSLACPYRSHNHRSSSPLTTSQHPSSPSQNQSIKCTHHHSSSKQQQPNNNLVTQQPATFTTSTNIHIDSKLLTDKISLLRQELVKRQVVSRTCKIDIRRRKIMDDSFRIVSQMSPRDLKKRLNVRFKGEEGVDFGGVAREWFHLLSRELLNIDHGLFKRSSDNCNLEIIPDSGIVDSEHLSYMHFCGRIMGMAVFHGHFFEGHFTLPFYKMLLRKPITLEDIKYVDPVLYESLCWMLNNDITDTYISEQTFSVEHEAFGQSQEHELCENGKEIAVTEKNKQEYVSLYVNYRYRRGIEKQSEALLRGFDELIEPCLLQTFSEHELELLIGGLSEINVDDWRQNTKLKNCTTETALVKWFWDIVKRHYKEDKREQLLQFVTGSPRVPIQGFKALRGHVEAELRPFTIHLIRNGNTNDLPKSHTCFNRLDLPPYETYDKLRDKLTQAIEETIGFAMQ